MIISKKILADFESFCTKNNITGKEKEEKFEQLKKFMQKIIYEPGEAVGIVAAQSISEPATQMSLDYEEKIILKHNGTIKITTIGSFTDEILNTQSFSADGWDVCDLSDMSIFVPSINQDEKIEWKKVLACSRHESPQSLIKISTLSGRAIVATDSHSFVTRRNNKTMPVSGKELKRGDRIPSIKLLPENCIDSINIKYLVEEENDRARKPLPAKLELNESLGWIFGAYLAEGNCTKNYVNISSTDINFLDRVKQFASTHSFSFNEYDNYRGFAKGHDIRINSTVLSALLSKSCGKGAENKKIPDFAYSANEKFVSALLSTYFDGDGNVSVTRGVIRASSNSKELIDGVALLLCRFGIFACKGKGKQFTLVIPGKYAHIFREKIEFGSYRKALQLDELCRLKPNIQDFTDMISGFDDILYKIAKKLHYPTRYVNNFTKRQKIGRSALLKYIVLFEGIAKEKGINITEELSILKRMYVSDVVWDEITDITEAKSTNRYVYDLTVEGTQTFTTFDGIVTHNTMRSYILATQRDRLSKVTQGLPRLIEIFDVRKTFEKNMKIYFNPEWNTKERAREVANKIRENKVEDILVADSIDLINMRVELELKNEKDRENIGAIAAKHIKADVSFRGNKVFIKPKKEDIKLLRKIRSKLLKAHVDGIKGIEEVIVVKDGEDWMIQTAGTNIKKVLRLDEVDSKRTRTNDVHQVYEVMGIEAARNVILQEAKEALDEQGLDVDIRHLILLADVMTVDGDVKAIGRYGVSGGKTSVLARANFEETKKHIVNASFYGEKDDLDGIIENVLIGQLVPIGTGMVELAVDVEKMKSAIKPKKSE